MDGKDLAGGRGGRGGVTKNKTEMQDTVSPKVVETRLQGDNSRENNRLRENEAEQGDLHVRSREG